MTDDYPRTRRVGEQIRRELADVIRLEIKDPRVGSVTVSEVRVSPDMRYADVMVTRLGGDAEASQETVDGLARAAGFLRSRLGRRLHLRNIPALRFHYDDTFERGARLSRLIDRANRDDQGDHD